MKLQEVLFIFCVMCVIFLSKNRFLSSHTSFFFMIFLCDVKKTALSSPPSPLALKNIQLNGDEFSIKLQVVY